MKTSKFKLIIIIRHGERADLADKEIKINKNDPELTEEGKTQAYEAGKRLIDIIPTIYPKNDLNIALISSPFSRCLMTSKYLKNGMDLDLPIYIENGISEFISKNWFNSSPSDFLAFYHYHPLLMKELQDQIIMNESYGILPEFPESQRDCISRFNVTLDMIVYYYGMLKNFDIIILVTHYMGIQCLLQKMNMPLEVLEIEYCSTFIFKYNVDSGEYSFETSFYPIDYEV